MEKEETKLQNTIRAELSKIGIVQQNNVVTFLIVYGKTIAIGLPRESDLTLFASGGKTVLIQIKNAQGRQSKPQKAFEKRVNKLGLEDAKELIREVKDNGNLR